MTGKAVSSAEDLVNRLYEKYPEAFNQPDNKELFKLYLSKVLGFTINPLAEMRISTYFWPTFERTCRLKVANNTIKLSEENKEARHIEEEQTKKTVKEHKSPINYGLLYTFVDGKAIKKQ